MAQKRSASVGPKVPPFPNLKLKENQFALPLPPDGLSVLEKKAWLQNEWEEMWERPARRAAHTKNNFAKGASSPTAVGRAKGKGKGGGRARLVTEQKRGSIW